MVTTFNSLHPSTTLQLHPFCSHVALIEIEVFDFLKAMQANGPGYFFFGHQVCHRFFKAALKLGKRRVQRLFAAVKNEKDGPPEDLRSRPRNHEVLRADSARPVIVEWLQTMYHEVAESLPEALHCKTDGDDARLTTVKRRGKRPRHYFKQESKEEQVGYQAGVKFLPPGTLGQYLELCRADHPSVRIGRKLFNRDSWPQNNMILHCCYKLSGSGKFGVWLPHRDDGNPDQRKTLHNFPLNRITINAS